MTSRRPQELFDGFTGEEGLHVGSALGYIGGIRYFRKFGMNPAVAVSTTQQMWPGGTPQVLPTSAAVASVVSSDAADTNTSGTGSWTVTIEGLDSDFNEVSETVNMNGVTPVNTTQTFIRIYRAYNVTAGTGGINAGNISVSVGGNLQAYIEADQGQTHQTQYTVPAGHTLVVTGLKIGVGRMSGSTDLHVLSQIRLGAGAADEAWRSISDIYLWNGSSHNSLDGNATVIPEKTDIRQVINSTTTTQAFAIFSGFLIDNTYLPA